jgi:hypothetical protein
MSASIVISLGKCGEVSEFAVSNDLASSDDLESSPKNPCFPKIQCVLGRLFCCESDLRQQEQPEG